MVRNQQWACRVKEGFVFSTKNKKKNSEIKKNKHKQFFHLPFHCTHYYAKLWNSSLQQTRNQNQSNEKREIVAKSLKVVSTTNQKPKSIKWKVYNCCQKLGSYLYNKLETKTLIMFFCWLILLWLIAKPTNPIIFFELLNDQNI